MAKKNEGNVTEKSVEEAPVEGPKEYALVITFDEKGAFKVKECPFAVESLPIILKKVAKVVENQLVG